jgi:pyruvate/2-oxoglutarate dehydrogenase complex dihydrolipoamide acyltransferase (E2) component
MPQLGESIAEATVVDIKVKTGDEVVTDQEIVDVDEQSRYGRDYAVQRQDR